MQAQLLQQIGSMLGAFAQERASALASGLQTIKGKLAQHAQQMTEEAQGVAEGASSALAALRVGAGCVHVFVRA